MFEILKSLLAGTPFEGLLKLFSGLFGESENVDNQQNTNEDSSSQENPFPSNEPNPEGGTTSSTSNEDFNLDEIWKQVEDVFGGGTNSNASPEPENGEIEPSTEPEMEPEIEPEPSNVDPIPTNSPEPISAPEPEAQPMPSAEELKESSNSLGKDADNLVVEDESLGFEPETEADKGLDMNSKPTNEEESLGFESENESNKPLAAHSKPIPDSESLGFENE